MGRKINLHMYFLSIILLFIIITACNKAPTIKKEEEKQILTLIENQEPPTLDSAKATDLSSFKILKNTMEGLTRIAEGNQLILGLAKEMPQESTDKKTYLIKLRDANWSDGKPVTSHDFVYAWKRVLNPRTKAEYAYMLYPILNAEKYNLGQARAKDLGIKAIDSKTLEVKLEYPTPYFKDLLSFPTFFPQRKDIVNKYNKEYALEAHMMVFNGPFILSEWKHGKSFQYKKNTDYWDKKTVKLEIINHYIVKDMITSFNLYKKNKVDYLTNLDPKRIGLNYDHTEKFISEEAATCYVELNHRKQLFRNKKIRQAMAMAINKKILTEDILINGSTPTNSLVPPNIEDNHVKEMNQLAYSFQPLTAKKLWESGLKELGIKKPRITIVGNENKKHILESIQKQLLTNLDLTIRVKSIPLKELLYQGRNGQFDLLLSEWNADYNDALTFLELFQSTHSFNYGGWHNKKFDSLIIKSKGNEDLEERCRNLYRAEKTLLTEAGIIPLYWKSRMGLKKSHVRNLTWHHIGPETLKWAYIYGKTYG